MKMHPRPMKRHTHHVAPCEILVRSGSTQEPVHIVLGIDGKSQRIIMTADEAKWLAKALLSTAKEIA